MDRQQAEHVVHAFTNGMRWIGDELVTPELLDEACQVIGVASARIRECEATARKATVGKPAFVICTPTGGQHGKMLPR